MFEYTVWRNNSPEKFKEACKRIDQEYPNAVKSKLLIDVDGSTLQIYTEHEKKIKVFDDYDVGAVYIEAEIDLRELFGQELK